MKEKVEVMIYTCDGCGRRVPDIDEETPAYGFFGGYVNQHDSSHGVGVDSWFACREKCITKAITTALRRAWCGCKVGCEQCS